MLQDALLATGLRRADQLLPIHSDLVCGGDLEADGIWRALPARRRLEAKRVAARVEAQRANSRQEGTGQAIVAFEHRAGQPRVIGGTYHGIGQLIGVEDGAAASRTADHLPAVRLQAVHIDIGEGLRVAERKTGGLPGIQAQCRAGLTAAYVLENRFIHGHVPGAMRRRRDEKSPGIRHAQIIMATEGMPIRMSLADELRQIIARCQASSVGLAARHLGSGTEILIEADQPFHPASTTKICIMMEAYRQARAGEISLEETVPIRNEFHSIADGSLYSLQVEDDSETELYERIEQQFSRRELIRRMITVSSNLASNLLLDELDPRRVTEFMHELGAADLNVLRGFEDKLAYRRGMNSAATARGFMQILTRLARKEVVSSKDSEEMIEILFQQEFNEMIPAGLPAGVKVAHKTGWTADFHHDVGIIYPPMGEPIVLCILTKGYEENEETQANAFVASLAKTVYDRLSNL